MAGHIYGCHACGVKHPPEAGLWVADHQPPNNDAKRKANEPFRQAVSKLSFGRFGGRPPQQFYPHCKECSTWQVRDHCMLGRASFVAAIRTASYLALTRPRVAQTSRALR